jgi:PAS domain S-box-containing protein
VGTAGRRSLRRADDASWTKHISMGPTSVSSVSQEEKVHLLQRIHELEALLQSVHDGNEHYRAIVEHSDDGIISKDLNGIITSWNQGAERIFGHTAAEMIGRSVRLLIPEELQGQEETILARIRRGERVDHFETERLHRSGARVPVSLNISPIKDSEGRIFGASKIVRDITAQKQADSLRNHLSAIVESSDDAIISKDLQGIITSWNQGAEHIFGHTAEEMIGTPITRIVPDELMAEEADILQRVYSGERIEHFRTTRIRKDGAVIPISITVSPVRNDAGKVIGASKVARDFTEQLRIEKRLEGYNRNKDHFLATLAHELRNPLAPLTNAWELMGLSKDEPATIEKAHAVIGRQLRQLTRLVNDLMDINRVSHGKLNMTFSVLDLHKVLREAFESAQPVLQEAGHTVEFDLSPQPIEVRGDVTRLVQVFGNLLSNAGKYSPPGSHIIIRTRINGDKVRVQVQDNGVGLAPEDLERIFEMFAQVEFLTGERQGGLGIGLSLVKKLVAMHQGSVTAASEGIGKGTTITVELPLAGTAVG